ncbi:MAG: tRNA (adenosine(37)-N6)-dimethylallyltransferase MiaA [Clostridia bacterium]|nr:tRNA (adenosine(37)-N6)-dimethylallyltransferase MiaA [Clostridia bacterium]
MDTKPRVIAVVGTNASGKSGLGIQFAAHFHGEVISADSRQVYKGLDLGSGKVTEEEMQGVPHHLLDVCEPGHFFSMADFQRLSYEAIDDILSRGKTPFIVGGTGLYVDSVCDGYVLSNIEPDLNYRRELEKLQTEELYAMLIKVMPETEVDPRNRNRVMRVLEKIHDGDMRADTKQPRYDVLRLGVTWDRETLCRRIDERLKMRMQQGMLDEVQRLIDAGVTRDFLYRLGLEYRYIAQYLLGEISDINVMLDELSKAIKRFAKRQMTWFRRDKSIIWLDMQNDPKAQAIREIEKFLGA